MLSPKHPLWLVGFRPFFSLACLAGLSLPIAWILIFKGVLPAPAKDFSPIQWHAHEMFFGFGWAVLGGFLLTATKNWVGVRGYHGATLIFLATAWLFERIGMSFGASWPAPLFLLSNNLFLLSIVVLLLDTLIRNREKDSYRRDNILFLIILPLFWIAKTLLLQPEHFHLGWSMALGLFRVAFLVMFERTLTQFMRSAFQVEILRQPLLDTAIKGLAALLVFGALLPLRWPAASKCCWPCCSWCALSSGIRSRPSPASRSASCTSATWPSPANCYSTPCRRRAALAGSAPSRSMCSPSAPWASSSRP